MSFTNSTPNYGLPQWIAADKPKFLTDINNAFSTIDTQLKNANDTANTAADNSTSALSIAGQAATTAEGAATVAGQAAALAQSVNELVGTINAKLGTTSIATIGDGTVTGAIDSINTVTQSNNDNIANLLKYNTGSAVSLASYNSSSNQYTCPSDGYIRLNLAATGHLRGTIYLNEIMFISCNDSLDSYFILPCFVKKGSKIYVENLTGSAVYSPLT